MAQEAVGERVRAEERIARVGCAAAVQKNEGLCLSKGLVFAECPDLTQSQFALFQFETTLPLFSTPAMANEMKELEARFGQDFIANRLRRGDDTGVRAQPAE